MLDESLILRIRERAINLSTRLDVPCSGDLPATASSDMIRQTEQSLGFCLHPEHRQILMSVANGGFGPAYAGWPRLGRFGPYRGGDSRKRLSRHPALCIML